MSSRDRKRAARRKRKDRTGSRPVPSPASTPDDAAAPGDAGPTTADPFASAGSPTSQGSNGTHETVEDVAAEAERRGIGRSEVRNERAREELEPLEEGERPTVVTVGAILSLAIALSILIGYASGAEVEIRDSNVYEKANAFQVFPPAILFLVMAYGMWRARYWAVLGFQAIMAIIMIGAFLALITATDVFFAVSVFAVLAAASTLFWFTVKALARIQMPTPYDRDRR